jgi:hypothetical protein
MTTTRSKRASRVLEDTSSWGKNHSIASFYTITSFGVPNTIVVSTRFTVPILVPNSKGIANSCLLPHWSEHGCYGRGYASIRTLRGFRFRSRRVTS